MMAIFFSRNPLCVKIICLVLILGLIGYIFSLLDYFGLGTSLAIPAWVFASIIPSFLLLLAWVILDERQDIPNWLYLIIITDIFFETFTSYSFYMSGYNSSLMLFSSLKQIALSFFAVYLIWLGKKDDLVETRAIFRIWLIVGLIVLLLPILLTVLVTGRSPQPLIIVGLSCKVLIIVFLVNIVFLKKNPTYRFVRESIRRPNLSEIKDPKITELLDKMTTERLYKNRELRIAALADELNLKEYQLRKKINQGLGYRNFNQFVNHFRINEAKDRLLVEPDLPVLSIAIDVGFNSISSFNSAFLSQCGTSPTAYRQDALMNSEKT